MLYFRLHLGGFRPNTFNSEYQDLIPLQTCTLCPEKLYHCIHWLPKSPLEIHLHDMLSIFVKPQFLSLSIIINYDMHTLLYSYISTCFLYSPPTNYLFQSGFIAIAISIWPLCCSFFAYAIRHPSSTSPATL